MDFFLTILKWALLTIGAAAVVVAIVEGLTPAPVRSDAPKGQGAPISYPPSAGCVLGFILLLILGLAILFCVSAKGSIPPMEARAAMPTAIKPVPGRSPKSAQWYMAHRYPEIMASPEGGKLWRTDNGDFGGAFWIPPINDDSQDARPEDENPLCLPTRKFR